MNQRGFSIAEMLVAMSIFAVFGLSVTVFMAQTMNQLSVQSRATLAAQEAQNAMSLIAAELRMSGRVSPYIPGNDAAVVNCTTTTVIAANSIKFLVVHDDVSSPNGIRAYYVGYVFNAATGQLSRGEVLSSSTSLCSVPGTDPTNATVARTIADNIVAVDIDHNGSNESVFSLAGSVLNINFGVQISGARGVKTTQALHTEVKIRNL